MNVAWRICVMLWLVGLTLIVAKAVPDPPEFPAFLVGFAAVAAFVTALIGAGTQK